MTDEEKACKAICNSEPCKILCTKAKCYLGELAEEKTKIKYRFLDIGAKVGELALNYIENLVKENENLKALISQWHDLRKDPNDLPSENCECWCYVEYFGSKQHRKVWYNGEWVAGIKVIAWCELPKFEEED